MPQSLQCLFEFASLFFDRTVILFAALQFWIKMLSKVALGVSARGGAKHKPAPVVDVGKLSEVFGKHKAVISDFGCYEHINRSQAAKGLGIVSMYDFLKDMLKMCPSADMPGTCARSAMISLIVQEPTLNKTIYNSSIWAGTRCERLGTVLYHLRRLAREEDRFRQAAMAMPGIELSKLKELCSMVVIDDSTCVSIGIAQGSQSDDDATVAFPEDGSVPKSSTQRKRSLVKNFSDVSVDEEGFPNILCLDKGSTSEQRAVPLDSDGFPLILCGGSSSSSGAELTKDSDVVPKRLKTIKKQGTQAKSLNKASVEVDANGFPLLLVEGSVQRQAISQPNQSVSRPSKTMPKKTTPVPTANEKTWMQNWYKNNNSVGVRRGRNHEGNSKSQIFSFMNPTWTQDDLQDLGRQCLEKLHNGDAETAVMLWAKDLAAQDK